MCEICQKSLTLQYLRSIIILLGVYAIRVPLAEPYLAVCVLRTFGVKSNYRTLQMMLFCIDNLSKCIKRYDVYTKRIRKCMEHQIILRSV